MDDTPNDLQAVIDAARLGVEPIGIEEKELYAVPAGHSKLVAESLEKYRDEPDRKRGNFWPQTVDSFIDYVGDQKTNTTTVWVTPNEGHIEALFNDHGVEASQPGWGDHRAILDLIESPEWEFWLRHDGELLAQVEFANHIEEGLADLLDPAGADMLEIAQKIEGTNSVAFKSKIDLTSGEVRVGYDEQIEASAETAAGQLAIPKTFTIGIAPFVGEDAFKLTCRLRYRVQGGNLLLGYKIDRPDAAVREVLKGIHAKLTDKFEGIVYYGTTPSGDRIGAS